MDETRGAGDGVASGSRTPSPLRVLRSAAGLVRSGPVPSPSARNRAPAHRCYRRTASIGSSLERRQRSVPRTPVHTPIGSPTKAPESAWLATVYASPWTCDRFGWADDDDGSDGGASDIASILKQ